MKNGLIIAIAILALVAGIAFAVRSQRILLSGLPEREVCASREEAETKAGPTAIKVLGTGSMAPFIPAAKPGENPLETVAALVVPDFSRSFDSIKPGELCCYLVKDAKFPYLHGAALLTDSGWVMSGLANKNSEPYGRVTKDNFIFVAKKVYVW